MHIKDEDDEDEDEAAKAKAKQRRTDEITMEDLEKFRYARPPHTRCRRHASGDFTDATLVTVSLRALPRVRLCRRILPKHRTDVMRSYKDCSDAIVYLSRHSREDVKAMENPYA